MRKSRFSEEQIVFVLRPPGLEIQAAYHVVEAVAVNCREDGGWLDE